MANLNSYNASIVILDKSTSIIVVTGFFLKGRLLLSLVLEDLNGGVVFDGCIDG